MPRPARPARTTSGGHVTVRRWATTAALALLLAGCAGPAPEPGSSSAGSGTAGSSAASSSADAGRSSSAQDPSAAPAPSSTGSASSAPSSSAPSSGAAADESLPLAARSNERVPMRAYGADEQPPQFILYSFDGGLQNSGWDYFQKHAAEADAHFTVFQSGIHLLDVKNREKYAAPGNKPGYVNKELGGDEAEIAARVTNINEAYAEGHEIGTHYNGHLCATAEHGGDKWSTAEWKEEIASFGELFSDPRAVNGYGPDFPEMEVPVSAVQGSRLPCLDGTWSELVPAWKEAGYRYDTSGAADSAGVAWPYQKDGIWEFEMPIVYSPTLAERGKANPTVMAMDYNFWISGNGGKEADTEMLRQFQLDTYRYMYKSAYHGNRAPLVFGNHFNDWGGNAFNPAVAQTMKEFCTQKDTYCVTYQQMMAWLELQDPEVLAAWQARGASATGADAAELGW